MEKTKIAIACQGGGSHAAFTAGVLKTFFRNKIHEKYEIVSLSGTSGGAICAAISWYSLIKAAQGDSTPVEKRLIDFWQDISTQDMYEVFFNTLTTNYLRLNQEGIIPIWNISPNTYTHNLFLNTASSLIPRKKFLDLKEIIESYIDFNEIESWRRPTRPILVIGAANVSKGQFRKFISIQEDIQVEFLLASAAVPTLFPAVKIGEDYYWDGLFSDNPPIEDLIKARIIGTSNVPQEIWIIQINPETCKSLPASMGEIINRRNEMEGNLSLYHAVDKINFLNFCIENKIFDEEFLELREVKSTFTIRKVQMSEDLQEALDYTSKMDRSSQHINELIHNGEIQCKKFLQELHKEDKELPEKDKELPEKDKELPEKDKE